MPTDSGRHRIQKLSRLHSRSIRKSSALMAGMPSDDLFSRSLAAFSLYLLYRLSLHYNPYEPLSHPLEYMHVLYSIESNTQITITMNFFGKKQTPDQLMRTQNREIRRAQRDVDKSQLMRTQNREIRRAQRDVDKSRNDIEKQEKQLEIQIKKAAKEGNKQLCQTLAKQLVQLRKSRTRTVAVGANIGAIGSKSKVCKSMALVWDVLNPSFETFR
ncbi:unnamed protein product [Oppiella nova]|uniref:Uncharacterized protein n=1 Tax=Oppiella nova TaxID=334625 RepID=A0A7R9Q8V8_9ACAR|nr:unnamed protein product [Oppiella nova]CAG2158933.1 unnamed protein product [Oppiella nova]